MQFLKNLEGLDLIIPNEFRDFVQFFKDFQGVMESVMGFTLDSDYLKMIENLRRSFDSINSNFDVTEIPKLHIVLTHVTSFLAKTKGPSENLANRLS